MITENRIEQAKNTDMVEFLVKIYGYHFKSVGSGFRPKEHESLCVGVDRKQWFWHSHDVGGYGAIDFLVRIEGYTFIKAVEIILNCSHLPQAPINPPPPPLKVLQLPQRAHNQNKLWHYLCEVRKLDPVIVKNLLQQGLMYQDVRGNVVFVGNDETKVPKFACVRGTYPEKPYRKDCFGSDKSFGFHMTYEKNLCTLFVFESPIDCMSHGSLMNLVNQDPCVYFSTARLSLGGVSSKALDGYLKRYPLVDELIFCLDNDAAGGQQSVKLARDYAQKGYYTSIELPTHKDYNEMLVSFLNERGDNHE